MPMGERMRVRARISFVDSEIALAALQRLKVKFRLSKWGGGGVLYMFVDDPRYSELLEELQNGEAHPIVFKEPLFTEQEMESAEFFEILSVAQWGYPQPEDDFGYEKISFDKSTACPLCGIGAIQTKPYFVSGHPKFGRNDITALFWTYDLLVTQRLKNLVEEAKLTGVEFWPLLRLHGNGQSIPVEGAYELYVTSELPPAATSTEFPIVSRLPKGMKPCKCGRLGRNLPVQFHYRRRDLANARDFNKTHEWLGGGLDATRCDIVSRRTYELFVRNKIRGVKFSAVAVED